LEDCSEAIRLGPKNSDYYYNRGNTYSKIQNTKQAIIDFTKAIELNPEGANAYQSRAEAFNKAGNYVDAL
jgi:tetratricopeptide (TPR) repeat protein